MRKLIFFVTILLVACSNNGTDKAASPRPDPAAAQHAPQIMALALLPASAKLMDSDGMVIVTAEITATDAGRDLQALWVQLPDGGITGLDVSFDSETATFSKELALSTEKVGEFPIEFWLVDKAGNSSSRFAAEFDVVQHVPKITKLALSPETALAMEGDGSVVITAEITASDPGTDVKTLWVRLPDRSTIELDAFFDTETATFTRDFSMPTDTTGNLLLEFWLVDELGDSSNPVTARFKVVEHVPEITAITLSPNTARHMESDGNVTVTAEITFSDVGQDLRTVRVRLPNDNTVEVDAIIDAETATFSRDFAMPTDLVGVLENEFWLVDSAGASSEPLVAYFTVVWNEGQSAWTNRLAGLPYALTDVTWDGTVFIAVGTGGVVLTSPDGIDWTPQVTPTDNTLTAVAAFGPDIVAVGKDIVLLSTDHGENWDPKIELAGFQLRTVAINSSQIVIGGLSDVWMPSILISEDRGNTWEIVDLQSIDDGRFVITDLVYHDGLFVMAADKFSIGTTYGGWILVSSNAEVWDETFRHSEKGLATVIHAGEQFVAAGLGGTVFSSNDGFSWTGIQTPVEGVDYLSSAWDGSKLLLAGGYSCWNWIECPRPEEPLPVGLSSADGSVTWEIFNIDGYYRSLGLASGNGRFVSVGVSPVSDEGAIYTAD